MKKSRFVAFTGVLFALAIALSFLENMLSAPLGLAPGVKIGLANVVVMYAVYYLGVKYAAMLVVLKALFGFFARGALAGALSLGGGMLSLAVILMLVHVFKLKRQFFIISCTGAITHNIGQLIILSFVFSSAHVYYYAPILLIAGVAAGFLTSLTLRAAVPALEKINIKSSY